MLIVRAEKLLSPHIYVMHMQMDAYPMRLTGDWAK